MFKQCFFTAVLAQANLSGSIDDKCLDHSHMSTNSIGSNGLAISGIDLRNLSSKDVDQIRELWLQYPVLLFEKQTLSDHDLINFSRNFGELDVAPIQENGRRFVDGFPEIYVVSNVIENDVAIGSLGAGEAVWHTDMSYLPLPAKASLLYALEIPSKGGDTSFCDMYAALELVPSDLRKRITGLRVKHDGTYNSGGYVRKGVVPHDDPRFTEGTFHPLVCVHPESRRQMLYLGRRRNSWIEGFSLEDSNALLDQLWSFASQSSIAWTHRWRVSDLVLWDNRCTMHRRDPFASESRRVMHRTQIKGSTPIPVTGE